MANSATTLPAKHSFPIRLGLGILKSVIIRYLFFAGLISILFSTGVIKGQNPKMTLLVVLIGSFALRGGLMLLRQAMSKRSAVKEKKIYCDGLAVSDIAVLDAYAKVRQGNSNDPSKQQVESLRISDFDSGAIELLKK